MSSNELVSVDKIKTSLAEYGVKKAGEPLLNKIMTAVVDLQAKKGSAFNYGKVALQLATDASRILNAGLNLDDHDLIYTIARGDVITLATHYEATLRVAKRRGYIIIPSFYPVFEGETIEFSEQDGEITVKVNENGKRFSREIKPDDLLNGNLIGCGIKIDVRKMLKDGSMSSIVQRFERLSNEEIMKVQKYSSSGLFVMSWEVNPKTGKKFLTEKKDKDGKPILNNNSFWYIWTTKMVYKTCLRYCLSFIKESLPEFKEIYDFIDAEYTIDDEPPVGESRATTCEPIIDAEIVEDEKVDLNNPSPQMLQEINDLCELFSNNDSLADEKAIEIADRARSIDKNNDFEVNRFKKENGSAILALHKLKKANAIFEAMKK